MLAMTRASRRRAAGTRSFGPLALVTAAVALALLASACATGGATEAAEHNAPTFHKLDNPMLRATEPISSATDLLQPAKAGEPWRIVGSVLDPQTDHSTAAVWSAADGRTWDRQDIEPKDDSKSESMAAVTRVGNDLLAVGRVAGDDQSDAAIWRYTGGKWHMDTPAAMRGKHDQWAFQVTAGRGGILVAGGENAWGEVRPRLWFSPDGKSWRSVDGGPGGPLDRTGEESIQGITAFKDGFVAVGWRDVDGEQSGVAWYSPDGMKWDEVQAPTLGRNGDGRQSVQSVVAFQDRVIAGGYWSDATGQGKPVTWTSLDGRTWSPATLPLPSYPGYVRNATSDMSVRALSTVGNVVLAAGGDDWRPHMWRSDDAGATWRTLPDPTRGTTFDDGMALEDIASFGPMTLALGGEPIVAESQGGRWIDRTGDNFPTGGDRPSATSVMVDGNNLIATGYSFRARTHDQRRHYTGRIWVDGGGDLEEVKPKEPKPNEQPPSQSDPNQSLYVGKVNDVVRYKGGYVAVGFEDFAWAAQRSGSDARPDGVLWSSKDGRKWDRMFARLPDVDRLANLLAVTIKDADPTKTAQAAMATVASQPMITDDPAGGNGTRNLEAVAPIGNGFIAVGSVFQDIQQGEGQRWDTDPIVAISPDGKRLISESTGLGGPNGTERFRDVCVHDDKALAIGVTSRGGNVDVAVRYRDKQGGWHAGVSLDKSFEGAGNQEAIACAASKDGYLMVGSDNRAGNTDARVWFSKNGTEWRQLSASGLGGSGDQEARAVAAAPQGGWLVGGVDTRGGDSDAALWRVDEKGTVTRRDNDEPTLSGPGTQTISGIYVSEASVVLVGEDEAGVAMWESRKLDR
jgi:hypothetical protein